MNAYRETRPARGGMMMQTMRILVYGNPTYPPAPGRLAVFLSAFLFLIGCTSTVRTTDPERTATERFLTSQAVAEAVSMLNVEPLRDRAVYIDAGYLVESDRFYLLGELRAHFFNEGIRLVEGRDQAVIVVEVRSPGIGIDRSDLLVGFPQFILPTSPDSSTGAVQTVFATPEIALFKNIKQRGFASVAMVAYWADSGEVLASSGSFIGRTFRNDWWIFGLGHNIQGDIPPTEEEP